MIYHQSSIPCPFCNTATYVIAAPQVYRKYGRSVITVDGDGVLHSCLPPKVGLPDTFECVCGALKTDGQPHTHRPRHLWPGRIEAGLGGLAPPADTIPATKTAPASPERATDGKGGIGL